MPGIIVLGSGMAGFGAAYRLHAEGITPVIYDKNSYQGGHTASFRYESGFLFDVGVLRHLGGGTALELTSDNGAMLYAPEGFAHGYQTLQGDTEMYYLTSASYAPAATRVVRYDDPVFGVRWPLPVSFISVADRQWPDFPQLSRE